MLRLARSAVCLTCLSLTPALPAANGSGPPNGKNNNNFRRETPQQRAREQAQKLRLELEREQKAAAELAKKEQAAIASANQELLEAKNAFRSASKTLGDAKARASADVEKSLGIEKAQADMSQAQKAYDAAAEPVLKSVRESADYKAARHKAAEAESAIKAIKDDETISDADKRSRTAELFPKTLAASELEKQALKEHKEASAAHDRLEAAQHRVTELKAKVDGKVEKDDAVRAARESVEKARAAVESAESRLASVKAGNLPRDKDAKKGNDQSKKD